MISPKSPTPVVIRQHGSFLAADFCSYCDGTKAFPMCRESPNFTADMMLKVRMTFCQVSAASVCLQFYASFSVNHPHHHASCINHQPLLVHWSEMMGCLSFLTHVYDIFGFKLNLKLSTRPEKFLGEISVWDEAEKVSPKGRESFLN